MTTYAISFYPGMVLSKPYYVTVYNQTTDVGALMDLLADELSEEGADGLFDDNNVYSDDEVIICGNKGRRLITGGMLNIEEVKPEHVISILREKAGTDYPIGTISIRYFNKDNEDVDVRIVSRSVFELANLWMAYCKNENNPIVNISKVEILKDKA